MMLMLATLAHASADDDREAYAVLDNGTLTFYCDNQKATHSGAIPLNEGDVDPEWLRYASVITTVEFTESFQYARPKTCYFWFSGCSNLTEIKGIQYLNTSEVTNMSCMFLFCPSLQSLDLSGFNTAKVTNMNEMFCSCSLLSSLPDITKWNIANVANIEDMFQSCNSLKSVPSLSNKNK